MRWECLFLFRLPEEYSSESGGEEVLLVRVEVRCKCTQVVICCRKSARWNWTEACTVSLGGVKAFGIVVRFGSSASAKSVPRVTNNASELQHIVRG